MNISELFETRQAPLYHVMKIEKALTVFDNDRMDARWEHEIDGRKVLGNSFTRNPRLNWSRPVKLHVDQQKLNMTNKTIPLDGEYVHRKTHGLPLTREREYYGLGSDSQFSESVWREEFVVGPIKDVHRCINKISIIMPNFYKERVDASSAIHLYETSHLYCKKWSIALSISDEFLKFVEDAYDFRKKD